MFPIYFINFNIEFNKFIEISEINLVSRIPLIIILFSLIVEYNFASCSNNSIIFIR